MIKTYNVVIEKTEDGFYAECPAIVGVYAQGDTESEVMENIKDVLEMTLLDVKERESFFPEPTPAFPQITVSAVSVKV